MTNETSRQVQPTPTLADLGSGDTVFLAQVGNHGILNSLMMGRALAGIMCGIRQLFRKGEKVKVTSNGASLMALQEGHGGWTPSMMQVKLHFLSIYRQYLCLIVFSFAHFLRQDKECVSEDTLL